MNFIDPFLLRRLAQLRNVCSDSGHAPLQDRDDDT
jgi:hypothetical protein